ncbi:MAG: NAD(P)/FAD-dependent oxidoreductase [Gemmatimonadota bacterium]|nr:NAD(P)/FAD-dependent oxidoreductase [Gemmatimonadota bacterium]
MSPPARLRVVIIGGGFAGLAAARALRKHPVDVTLLDRTNHHLFQPLLYQVATAMLAPSDISVPIRWALRRVRNCRVLLGDVKRIDVERRVVLVDADQREIPYDRLIVAAGMCNAYFGHDEWEDHAPGLKSLDDALRIRRRFLLAFERAEAARSEEQRRRWLTFVVIGGGPTGVELAGMLPEVARAFRREYRAYDPTSLRVVLLEGGDRLLSAFDPALSAQARRDLEGLGVEVRTGTRVTALDQHGVSLADGTRIEAEEIFWAAGIAASPLTQGLVPLDKSGRVLVAPDCSVPGHPEVFVVGDLAAIRAPDGSWIPGVAPTANQTGAHAAAMIVADLHGGPRRPYRWFNKGDLATIGRHKAVARFGRVNVTGYAAWLLWLFVHVLYLAGFRNRLSVVLQWAYAYVTFQRGVRLITGSDTGEYPVPDTLRRV